jgi:solute carrier family 25 iron transporter 28/37
MMNVPFAFVIVSANENIKVYAKPKEAKTPLLTYFGCAFIAGMAAAILTNPMDVVKTRLQIQHQCSCLEEKAKYDCPKGESIPEIVEEQIELKYKNVTHAVKKIYKNEGWRGFYRGVMPRMMYVSPGVAISWGTYEFFKSVLLKDEHNN